MEEKNNEIKRLISSSFIEKIPIIKGERIQFKGEVQSGKTSNIIQFSFFLISKGYDVLIVSPMIKDSKQVKKRFLDIFKMNEMNIHDYVKFPFEQSNAKNDEMYIIIENDYENFIYIINSHYTKLEHFHEFYEKINRKLYVIIDESDIFNSFEDYHSEGKYSNSQMKLMDIINGSSGFCGFTGTAYSHIYLNDVYSLKCKNVFYIPLNKNYISLGHEKFSMIRIKDLYLNSKNNEWTISQKKHFYKIIDIENNKALCSGSKLPIMIVNVAYERIYHEYIKNIILEKNKNYTVIIVNDSRIKMYHKDTEKYFHMIQKALIYIQKNIKDHNYVFIVTCRQFSRGTSPRSEVHHFNNISQIIYATSIVYSTNPRKTTDELKQNILRIGGIFPGYSEKFEIRAYLTQEHIDILNKQEIHDSLNKKNIQKKENEERFVTEVVSSYISENKPHVMVSKSRGIQTIGKYSNNEWELTKDKIKIRSEEKKINSEDSEGTTKSKVVECLKKFGRMTIRDLYSKRTDWNFDNKGTDVESLNTICIRYLNKGILKREKNEENIYEYYL